MKYHHVIAECQKLQLTINCTYHSREKWKSEQRVTLETVNTSMTQKHANELTTTCWLTDDMINKVCYWHSFKEYGWEAFQCTNCQINVTHSFIFTHVLNSALNEALLRYSTYILNAFSFCLAGVVNNNFWDLGTQLKFML